jgi:hypothetical protein
VSRSTAKSQKSSASTWRRRDRAFRDAERQRRQANQRRRDEVAAASAAGLDVVLWRDLQGHSVEEWDAIKELSQLPA